MPTVLKSGYLNFLEPSGPVQGSLPFTSIEFFVIFCQSFDVRHIYCVHMAFKNLLILKTPLFKQSDLLDRPIYLELLRNFNPLKCSGNSMYHHDVQHELCILPLSVCDPSDRHNKQRLFNYI